MMGLEPTTFCMASRRSSQLSYIRERGQYSQGLGAVEGLVHEAIGQLVVLPADGAVADGADSPREAGGLERQVPERLVLHAVLARHLLHHQLGVRHDLDLP